MLDPEPQIPWLGSFYLSCGVDALTGRPQSLCSKEIHRAGQVYSISNNSSTRAHTMVEAIRGVHQQSRKHKLEGQGTVNSMSSLALDAPFAMQTSQFSSSHSFLVGTVVSGEYDFEKLGLGVLELTP
jgi:hypothetical protein